MSLEKCRYEARRWLAQAKADLRAAEGSVASGSYEWACFQSQQAGEKAIKALWYFHGQDPCRNSLQKLIQDFPSDDARGKLMGLMSRAQHLDKQYVPTRYPNGLPDLTPAEVFSQEDAIKAMDSTRSLIQSVEAMTA